MSVVTPGSASKGNEEVKAFNSAWKELFAGFCFYFPAGCVTNKQSRCLFLFPHPCSTRIVSEPLMAFDGVGFIKNIPPSLST